MRFGIRLILLTLLAGFPVKLLAIGLCGSALGSRPLQSAYVGASAYVTVYDQVLTYFPPHVNVRKLHSEWLPKSGAILEVGGGTGLIATSLEDAQSARSVEILDTSPEMLRVALNKGIDQKKVHTSSATDLRRGSVPIPAASIDGIVTNNVLFILSREQVKTVFEEARRVLKNGGRFTVSSMRTIPAEQMQNFLAYMRSEVNEMESQSLVPKGSAEIFFDTNRVLAQQAPNTYSINEIEKLGRDFGFKVLHSQAAFGDAGFFVAFEKLN